MRRAPACVRAFGCLLAISVASRQPSLLQTTSPPTTTPPPIPSRSQRRRHPVWLVWSPTRADLRCLRSPPAACRRVHGSEGEEEPGEPHDNREWPRRTRRQAHRQAAQQSPPQRSRQWEAPAADALAREQRRRSDDAARRRRSSSSSLFSTTTTTSIAKNLRCCRCRCRCCLRNLARARCVYQHRRGPHPGWIQCVA